MLGWNEHFFEADKGLLEGLPQWYHDTILSDVLYALNPSVWAPRTFSVDELIDLTGGTAQSIELVSCRPDSAQDRPATHCPRSGRTGVPMAGHVGNAPRVCRQLYRETAAPVRGNGRSPAWSAYTTPPPTCEYRRYCERHRISRLIESNYETRPAFNRLHFPIQQYQESAHAPGATSRIESEETTQPARRNTRGASSSLRIVSDASLSRNPKCCVSV